MRTAKSLLGARAEELAAAALTRMGYRVVERNFHCRLGELDIIAWDGDTLAFVEVRSHRSVNFGSPAESVTLQKQAKLYAAAQTYVIEKCLNEANCRFDVVEVVFSRNSAPRVEVIQGAFDAPG